MRSLRGWFRAAALLGSAVLLGAAAFPADHFEAPEGLSTVTVEPPPTASCVILHFAGPPELRIARITTPSGIDMTFASPGGDLQRTNSMFRDSPFPPNTGPITITVSNLGTRARPLSIGARDGHCHFDP